MEEKAVNFQEVRKEFQAKKQELSLLKSALHSLNTEKEAAYHQLKILRDKISANTSQIQELKSQRQALAGQVKELKSERDKLNLIVKEKAQAQQAVVQEKNERGKNKEGRWLRNNSSEFQNNPHKLKMEIARLERKLEIEVMPFPKEQELNKRLKEMKVSWKKLAAAQEAAKDAQMSRAEFYESRRKAQDTHQQVQETAQKSQDVHTNINTLYDDIRKWREEEKKTTEKYLKLKDEYQQKKQEQENLSRQLDAHSAQLKEHDEMSFRSLVRKKTAEVQEKMKKGKKLSTEDILAFQAIDR